MCRLILAAGAFDPAAVLAAAIEMSCGLTADHDNATKRHLHGWGAVWREADTGELRVHRDPRPAADTAGASPAARARTDFLAVHVRNASLPHTRGPRFTHPLHRPGDDWYFMHNGYLPTVHQMLGLPASDFDSAEYFDYLLPPGTRALEEEATLARLRAIPPGGMSGNAIAVRRERAHLVHWSPPDTPTPRFFQMHRLTLPGLEVVASEAVPSLAPDRLWRHLPADTVVTFPFPRRPAASTAEGAAGSSPERTLPCP
jgi:glutamine amidotransferase